MCGDSHLPPAPESSDLVAIIHPVSCLQASTATLMTPPLSRTNSNSSTTSISSSTSSYPSSPSSIQGRLRFSNRHPKGTVSEFLHNESRLASVHGMLNVRIHKYGSPLQFGDGNPVLHEFFIDQSKHVLSGIRLDLGVGENGVVGRLVSIVDCESGILGEGVIGRM